MEDKEDNSLILVSDGMFHIERCKNSDPETAIGFLMRRCAYGLTSPSGYACVGFYRKGENGKWRASIDAVPDQETDSVLLGEFDSRIAAMAVLWKRRREAYCQHDSR